MTKPVKAYACAGEETSKRLTTDGIAFWHPNRFSRVVSPNVMWVDREADHNNFITAALSRPLVEMPLPP